MARRNAVNNEKIENLLNLALDATEEERLKSLDLEVGFDEKENTWEVIVKFFGTEEELAELFQEELGEAVAERILIRNLQNEYAILTIPASYVEAVADLSRIEYMEKPKRLFFAVNNGKSASCITPLQTGGTASGALSRSNLSGKNVIVAVIDSGIDYSHPDFRNADGTTRILDLWDQTIPAEFSAEVINSALSQPTEQLRYEICPSRDISGHGTHVAGIAAGNGRASSGKYRGVAYESSLLIVKLGTPEENAFPRTTELMSALDYCIRKGREYGLPVAVNLSFGNNYGSHSGTSLIETFINDMSNYWKTSIVIGSGNEGASALHTAGIVRANQTESIELSVSEYETALNLQVWKDYTDEMAVSIVHPSGFRIGPLLQLQETQRVRMENTNLLFYYGSPSPYSPYQEIYFDFIPVENYIDSGIWRIELVPQKIVSGAYDMWLPAGGVLNQGTAFLLPVETTTLTIPSTASKAVTVGAYDARYNQPAAFSGRGFTRETNLVKPDLVAPGVDITSCAPGGGYASRTGTSMATPFVSGSAALMMEWGITNGNDPYLYGEKLKAYLLKGANRNTVALRTGNGNAGGRTARWPNPQLGWGALCVASSLPT